MRRHNARLLSPKTISLMACATLCAACLSGPTPSVSEAESNARPTLANDYRIPASPPVDESGLGHKQQEVTVGDGPQHQQVLFINFEGATLTRAANNGSGSNDNATTGATWVPNVIPQGQSFAYPAFNAAPYAPTYDAATTKSKIAALVTDWYKNFNVYVTTTRPTSGKYTMMVVGGKASSFISPAGSAVGVAPLDCGNSSQTNIGFAFADSLAPSASASSRNQSIIMVAETIAHEAGHTFGLEHTDPSKSDIMAPAVDPGVSGFLTGAQPLADGSAECGSGSTEDTSARLLSNVGPAPTGTNPMMPVTGKPTVAWLSPKSGEAMPYAFTIAVSASPATGGTATITRVDIQQGTNVLGSLSAAPYQDAITVPNTIASGTQLTLTAVAYDSAGQSASVDTTFTVKTGATQGAFGCLVNPDCESGKICQGGSCVVGTPSATCTPACSSDETCQADGTCTPSSSNPGTPGITPDGNTEIGKMCLDASVCGPSGFCVSTGNDRYCTRACTLGANACPINYECSSIESGYYCTPASSGGCSTSGRPSDASAVAWLLLVAALLYGRRMRRTV